MQNDTPTNFDDYQFALRGNFNNRRYTFNVRTVNGVQRAISGNIVTANVWNHVVGVYDGNEIRLYVNGVLAGSSAHTGDFVAANPNRRLAIGRPNYTGPPRPHAFTGRADEVRLYRRALGLNEINLVRQFTRPCFAGYDHYAVTHLRCRRG